MEPKENKRYEAINEHEPIALKGIDDILIIGHFECDYSQTCVKSNNERYMRISSVKAVCLVAEHSTQLIGVFSIKVQSHALICVKNVQFEQLDERHIDTKQTNRPETQQRRQLEQWHQVKRSHPECISQNGYSVSNQKT